MKIFDIVKYFNCKNNIYNLYLKNKIKKIKKKIKLIKKKYSHQKIYPL